LLLRRFDRRHTIAPDSHKANGNSVRRLACRKTCGFPGPGKAELIGRLIGVSEKGLKIWDSMPASTEKGIES
jgi:hypothetical protein